MTVWAIYCLASGCEPHAATFAALKMAAAFAKGSAERKQMYALHCG